ncbi:ArsR/SmtB family transcription factor [Altererythrobacter sp. GH1-8]|uniref:ArsR/SmtB family transcription factor n=1 Tax=Altererythrobacter sp. GH1-8 TaxID=3349333 RepID=UPI00374D0A52
MEIKSDDNVRSDAVVIRLAALAQQHRLAVFRALVRAGNCGLAAGEIAQRIGMPASTLSFHLSHLKQAGLAKDRRQGRSIIYRADFEAIADVVDFLLEECCSEETCNTRAAQSNGA